MKVIDLLNKIANGEEVPKKIKYKNKIYNYEKFNIGYGKDYFNAEWKIEKGYRHTTNNNSYIYLNINDYCLNDEVEIIGEPQEHKIPEKIDIKQEKNIKNNWKWKVYGKEHSYNISTPQKIIADKINEIIDYLEEIE